ncbi:MAG: potassium channel family protein [Actinomycetes bacterium]
MAAKKLLELTKSELRREIFRSTIFIVAFFVVSLAIFFTLPYDGLSNNRQAVLRLVVGLSLLLVVIVVLIRRILSAPLPQLKTLEALVVLLVQFICLFAGTYLLISHLDAGAFTEPLTHSSALYFTIVTFGTVGFGDITPHSDLARLLVSAQIIIDFVFIAAIIRALVAVAQASLQKSDFK